MRLISLLFISLCWLNAFSQNNDSAETEVFQKVDVQPKYRGGTTALMKYLASIEYPDEAKQNDIEGTVYVQFVVEKDGTVSNVVVARSSKSKILDAAAVAQVAQMPKWKPGKNNRKPVRVQFVVPIRFKLCDNCKNK